MSYDSEGTTPRMYARKPGAIQILVGCACDLAMKLIEYYEHAKPVRMVSACISIYREKP